MLKNSEFIKFYNNKKSYRVGVTERTRGKLCIEAYSAPRGQSSKSIFTIIIDISGLMVPATEYTSLRSCEEPFPVRAASFGNDIIRLYGFNIGDVVMVTDGKGSEVGMKIIQFNPPHIIGTREFVDGETHVESSYPDLLKQKYVFTKYDIITTVK